MSQQTVCDFCKEGFSKKDRITEGSIILEYSNYASIKSGEDTGLQVKEKKDVCVDCLRKVVLAFNTINKE